MRLLVALGLALGEAYCQSGGSVAAEKSAMTAETNAPIQRVGPDDLLTIAVADSSEMSRNFRVAADGSVTLPLLKKPIQAAGKLPHEIETAIARELQSEELLVSPVVSVFVAEYRSIPVRVLGAVKRPITFQAAGQVTLMDALTRAEGLAPEAGAEILVSRPSNQEDKTQTSLLRRIPVHGLIDEADPSLNIRLYGGEEVRVPPAGKIYVLGNVKRSGAFPVQDGNDTTVLKAIAMTEGLLAYTNKDAFIYRRREGNQSREEIPVHLSSIMHHKQPDVPLQTNDILYIPDSSGKKMTAETVRILTGFGVSTMSGLVIWR